MGNVPIVFTFDDQFIVPAHIAIKSLIDYAAVTTRYQIIVIHYDLTKQHIRDLKKIVFNTNHTIKFMSVDKRLFMRYPNTAHWPVVVYIRLFLPELLSKYDKVIYSDVDVLFQGDLSAVYNMDLEGYEWGGIKAEKNSKDMIGHKYFDNNKNKYVYMSGFMVCNLKRMREIGFTDIIRNNIQKYALKLLMFDLDLLNMSSTCIKSVPIRYAFLISFYEHKNMKNTYEYSYMKEIYTYKKLEEEKKKTKIIHYAGGRGKPWLILCPDHQYFRYLCKLPSDLKCIYRKNKWRALKNAFVIYYKKMLKY